MTFWDDKNAILRYIDSSETSESERRELFKLSSVNKILADCLNSGFQFENIPLQERTQIYKSDELRSYLDENGIKTVIKDHELSELDIQDICFDKKLFSRLVGKYEDFSKSDVEFKYEILKKLHENNSFVFKTLHYGLFMDEILDMGFPFIEKMSRYNIFADNLLKIYSNQKTQKIALCFGRVVKTIIKSDNYKNIDNGEIFIRLINSFSTETILSGFINYEKFDLESLTEERLLVLAQIGLKLSSPYCNEKLYDINNGIKKKDAIDSSLTLLPKIINVDDLDNFEEKRIQLCDQIFKICINNNDLEGAKNAYLNKMFGINIQEATEIIRLYGSSIEQFSSDIKYENQFTYIQKINENYF